MSYAAKLVAISRGHAPRIAPRLTGSEAEAPREEVVETEVRAPVAANAPASTDVPRRAEVSLREPEAMREHADASEVSEVVEHRTTTAHHVVEHHETFAPPSARHESLEQEVVTMPASTQWLEEDRSAPDPLVASAETDALRELMQRVRQWTSSAPTVIEGPKPEAAVAPAAQVAVAPAPSQVSIGNVVITVEDAPAPQPGGGRAAAPTRVASDRMSRHHIRGG